MNFVHLEVLFPAMSDGENFVFEEQAMPKLDIGRQLCIDKFAGRCYVIRLAIVNNPVPQLKT